MYAPDPLDPIGKVFVTGVQLGAPGTWATATGSFTASQSGTVSVLIHNLVTASNSNDFAIDNITVVPEPSSLALLGIGSVVGLGVYVRRRRNSASSATRQSSKTTRARVG